MPQLAYRSQDYCRMGVKHYSVTDTQIRKRNVFEGTFDRMGYSPSKEFSKMKKDLVKSDELLKNRNVNSNFETSRERIKFLTNKVGKGIKLLIEDYNRKLKRKGVKLQDA